MDFWNSVKKSAKNDVTFFLFFLQLDKSDNEDGVYQASGSANIILYVGLGMICIGLVITFVGLGDKGFRTLELKLIGPSLVGCGVFFALLRVLFCTVPSCCRACCKCCRKTEDKEELIYATVSDDCITLTNPNESILWEIRESLLTLQPSSIKLLAI